MYKVVIHTDKDELGELVSLVATMKHTTLSSVAKEGDEPAVPKRKHHKEGKLPSKYSRDPRLVYRSLADGTYRINIPASLKKLGRSLDWLLANPTKVGTPEHSVKMAHTRTNTKKEVLLNGSR